MKPIDFKGANTFFAKDQPQYQPLPALVIPGPEGETITCWQFSEEEWERMSKNRCFYLCQLCFTYIDENGIEKIRPLQPILPMAELGDNYQINE